MIAKMKVIKTVKYIPNNIDIFDVFDASATTNKLKAKSKNKMQITHFCIFGILNFKK